LDIVDAVTVGHDRLGQAQDLAARPGRARPITQIHQLIGQGFDPQSLGHDRRQHQPSVGHRVVVVSHHVEPARSARC
jgi:hypothetical protein